jgi:superoxide dismutase, Cu-Zn family
MVNRFVVAAVALAAPIAALAGCSAEERAGDQTTTPDTTTAVPAGTERLSTQLKTPDGTPIANANFDFADGFATLTVETIENGVLSPGFHGLHIHSVGKCEANSVAPAGGAAGDFNSAGGHFQASGHTGHPASGDLTSLEVRSDGSAQLVTTTDSFTAQDLLGGEKTALIIHQDEDNFGHIPDRYSQPNGAPGPDQDTLATGDAGQRVACGVIDSVSATATTTTTTTSTTTPATVTETTVVPGPTTTTAPPPLTETTTTGTVTTVTTTTPPPTSPVETTPTSPGG